MNRLTPEQKLDALRKKVALIEESGDCDNVCESCFFWDKKKDICLLRR